jgi:allantoate deiminase
VIINQKRLLERLDELAEFGRDKDGGWTRLSFTSEYIKAQNLIRKWMEEVGMKVRNDAVGNLIGRLEGKCNDLPVVAMGSHIDTVKNGGKLDGNFGVVGGLEVAQTIAESGLQHKHPVEVIAFVEEEGVRFGYGELGSKAMVGEISRDLLYTKIDSDGMSIADSLKALGLTAERIDEARVKPGYYKAYLEMHIEQGAVLESMGIPVGIVEGISSCLWLKACLVGSSDHAGATPMNMRRDALVAASEIVLAAEKIAREEGESSIITIGQLTLQPGSPNVIPGQVEMMFDIRDISLTRQERTVEEIKAVSAAICESRKISCKIKEVSRTDPVILPDHMKNKVIFAANELGVSYYRIISGAGHDAQTMAKIADTAMIFAPSKGGLSHCPDEWTDPDDLVTCTKVLLKSVLKLI